MNTTPTLLSRILLALLCAGSSAGVSAQATSDARFLAAKVAFDKNDARKLATLAPALAGHVLDPYVQYWQLRLGLDGVEPAAVHAYLARYAGTPLAHQLRVDWLKSLAHRGQWTAFGQDYAFVSGEDVELACHAVEYRRQRDGDVALAIAKQYWFSEKATPDVCEPLFAALISKGDLSSDDRRARLRLAYEAGNLRLAFAIGASLAGPERVSEAELARIERDPLAALARGEFAWAQPAGRELALYALERAARRDSTAARSAWVKWRTRMPEGDRNYGNARLAYRASRQHAVDAYLYWREVGAVALSDEQHAWRVRAALRGASWPDVRAGIDAMSAQQASEVTWRYWRARALAATGHPDQAKSLYEELAKEFHFYSFLAAEALGTRIDSGSRPVAPAAEALAAFGARADVRRTLKLAELDLRPEMIREWAAVVRPLDDEGLLVAAEYMRRAGLHDRAINTAERTASRHDFAIRYLMPYSAQFEAAAREHDVDPALLFAIARQESRFIPDIVSSAGARGLMQLMPATAHWVAKQLGQNSYQLTQISDIDTNTRFGAYYFRYWLERLDRQPALAAAAYNAGPNRAVAWRPAAPLEGAAWVETIPFNETRDYVKKVLTNAMFYTRELGKPEVPMAVRLSTVAPRASGGGAPAVTAGGAVAVVP